jgi:hypothetical protein
MKPFTIVVYAASAVLSGRYVFQFQGFNTSGASFAAVGSFSADGFGTISDAVLDRNSVGGPPTSNLALTGTYTFDMNNVGTMTLSSPQGIASFRFTLSANAPNGISAGGKIIEFDNIKSGTGFIATQDTTGFSMPTITGDYVFNLAGSTTMNPGRAAAVGRLHADGSGVFSSGVMDMNQAGTVSADAVFTGTYTVPAAATNGRGTATLTTTLGGAAVTLNFTFYLQKIVQNAAVLVILSNDPVSGTQPLLSGSMEPQILGSGGATNNSLTGLLMMVTTGLTSTGLPDVSAGVATITSNGKYNLTADENNGGTITSIKSVAGTYILESNGRVTLPSTGGNHPAVLYLSRPNSGYLVGTDGNVSTGNVFAWAAPFSLQGTLYVSTGVPAAANQENDFGKLTFGGTIGGNLTGVVNIGSSTAFQPNTSVTGTYTTPDPQGRGTLTFTSGPHTGTSVFYLAGRSQLVVLDSISTGDMAPVVFSGGCIHFVSGAKGQVICQTQ